jgi:hypothetical protein
MTLTTTLASRRAEPSHGGAPTVLARSLHAEWTKLRTLRSTYGSLLATLAVGVGVAALFAWGIVASDQPETAEATSMLRTGILRRAATVNATVVSATMRLGARPGGPSCPLPSTRSPSAVVIVASTTPRAMSWATSRRDGRRHRRRALLQPGVGWLAAELTRRQYTKPAGRDPDEGQVPSTTSGVSSGR